MTTQHKSKVLIRLSWYSTPNGTISGSFIQEQAKLLINNYDGRKLYINFKRRSEFQFSLKRLIN